MGDIHVTKCKNCNQLITYNVMLGAFTHEVGDRICNLRPTDYNFMFATAEPKE